ncbi:arylamine N-acetyltransferase family protein [Halobacillus mangrovi]|uniref:arylamine N-acetyltransferase family protein n=1 Tax=Halobacillus mangrovi TaxID=402384 RepID=UPI003D961C3C
MSFNEAFRNRIGLSKSEQLTIANLDKLLEKMARSIPFENFRIIKGTSEQISKENLSEKILEEKEGGLCYELNPLLYYFLLENGFRASLVRGEVFNHEKKEWSNIGRTHVAVIIHDQADDYLVDTGFGGNLPLKPVHMNGETVTSRNGEYKVSPRETAYGDYVLEIKVKDKDPEMKVGYAFDSKPLTRIEDEMNEIQHIIETHENSTFNKGPLAVKLLEEGSQTLTATSYTKWVHGEKTKEQLQPHDLTELAEKEFGLQSP